MASLTQTQILASTLLRDYGLTANGWRFVYGSAKKLGGTCNYQKREIRMSKVLVPLWDEEDVRQILLHEIAHALVGPGHGHGYEWKRQARAIGYTGKRTHSNATVQGQWVAVCPVHGRGTRRYSRRRNLSCGRCYRQGIVNPLTYAAA